MADGRGRSDAEREAARLERERRRARRLGQEPPPPAPQFVTPPPPAVPPAHPGVEPAIRRAPVQNVPVDSEPALYDGDEHEEELDGEHYDDHPAAHHEDHPGADHDDHLGAYHDGDDDSDLPAGTRRVSALQRMADAPGRRPIGRRGGPKVPRTSKSRSTRMRVVSLIALALAAVLIWFLVELFQPFLGSPHGRIQVTIPAHSSSSQIGDLLARDGVISSSFFFKLRATLAGDRGKLRAGTYALQLGMSYSKVLDILTTPPKPAKTSDLTLVEGRTRRQIATLLRDQRIGNDYLALTRRSPLLNPRSYGAPASTPSLEGFLFPSTYQLRDPIKVSDLVADQLQTFRREFATVDLSYARRKHLTAYDVLIIASMVEAESATAHDRPLVASVIYNRLAQGMPLQIDATTRYATGNYTSPLTLSQLNSSSPYNTRIHTGLTPTPIDNPGLASIRAAANPAVTNFLYFVVKPCGNGEQTFTASYQQFLVDAANYQRARAARGGRSPANCRK